MKHGNVVSGKIHIGYREYYIKCPICGEAELVDYQDTIKQFIISIRDAGWRFIRGNWICSDCSIYEEDK
jgi:hypothetical protein